MKKIPIILIIFLIWISFSVFNQSVKEISYYPDFLNLIKDQGSQIEYIVLTGDKIQARLTDETVIRTYKPTNENISELLIEKEIPFTAQPEPTPNNYISLFTSIVIISIVIYMFRSIKNKTPLNYGKSNAQKYDNISRITFDHVAGIDEEKYELQEIIKFLRNPEKFQKLGARIPRGVLLAGPSGTGKTLLAKAVAGEAQVPFFSTSGSSFAEMFVGVGPSRVRHLFENAKKNAPCIVFIDEIDAMGKQRGSSVNNDERENTLNQLLVEMDGFNSNQGIIVIAATNRPDVLDPALLRPGRFDRQIFVGPPDIKGRESILEVHTKNKPIDKDVDLKLLAKQTPGFTGADLENLVNEAALLALRRDKDTISMDDLEGAIERVVAGTEKPNKVISNHEKKVVAFHEAGHALVGYLLNNNVHKVSIIPRGMAGGYTMMLPEETSYISKSQLLNKIKTLLAGRAAEEIIFGKDNITTGAQNDLERSTAIVRKMTTEYGMNSLGPITFTEQNMFKHNFSERTSQLIDKEIQDTINNCYNETKNILKENQSKLNALAQALIEKETLDSAEINKILD